MEPNTQSNSDGVDNEHNNESISNVNNNNAEDNLDDTVSTKTQPSAESNNTASRVHKRFADQAYEFLISLPSPDAFQEWLLQNETGFEWVHKRNSMTDAGKKYYYICNYRNIIGYVRCPAVIYALFPTNESVVMVFSCGEHDHRKIQNGPIGECFQMPEDTNIQNNDDEVDSDVDIELNYLSIANIDNNDNGYELVISLPNPNAFKDWLLQNETDFVWVHKRNSMTDAGKKYYYICNYRIRHGYVGCPALVYALFPANNESVVMVYSRGEHDHRRIRRGPTGGRI